MKKICVFLFVLTFSFYFSQSENFHDTQGNFEVNAGGQLQFTLPVALPPGIKNVAPQINLAYSSGSENGIAGYGWNISGTTAIVRTGKHFDKDGSIEGLQLDYSDYYSFNGQRLVLKSGEYGKDGAEYVTEKYSNIQIKSYGTIGGEQWKGPEYWEINFEDGSQAWYGSTGYGSNAGRTPLEYNIVKWKDSNGNYITYDYVYQNKISLISHIRWGGNETLQKDHFNEILFDYSDRNLKENSYIKGIKFTQNYILNNVTVKQNNSIFKKYLLSYVDDTNNSKYSFLKSITEYNSNGEAANPVVFDYENSVNNNWKADYKSVSSGNQLVGDFNGDVKVDILKFTDAYQECLNWQTTTVYETVNDQYGSNTYPVEQTVCTNYANRPAGLYLYRSTFDNEADKPILLGNVSITKKDLEKSIPITFKNNNNVVANKQGFAVLKEINYSQPNSNIDLKVFSIEKDSSLVQNYNFVIPYQNFMNDTDHSYTYEHITNVSTHPYDIDEIDLDGNGLSEIVVRVINSFDYYDPILEDAATMAFYNYLVIDVSTGQSNLLFPWSEQDILSWGKKGDFNGDGKIDVLYSHLGSPMQLYQFNFDNSANTYNSWNIPFGSFNSNLFSVGITGDFNGDKKTDLIIPVAANSFDWNLLISNGLSFESQVMTNLAFYNGNTEDINNSAGYVYSYKRNYFAQDLNKDGKSELIAFYSKVYVNNQNKKNSSFIMDVYENKGYEGNLIKLTKKPLINSNYTTFNAIYNTTNYKGYPFDYQTGATRYFLTVLQPIATANIAEHYSPIIGNFKINDSDEDILVFHNSKILKYSYFDISKEARIKKILQGGVLSEIEYKELNEKTNPHFYKNTQTLTFPNIELNRVSKSYAVARIKQTFDNSKIRKQDFLYRGYAVNLHGKGILGFRQTARSTWYADGLEATKVWTGVETDPLNSGVPIKEWTIRTANDNLVFPTNISANNNDLLSFKMTTYKKDYLLNGAIVSSPLFPNPNVVTALLPEQVIEKDFLKSVTSVNNTSYNAQYLPIQTINNIENNFAVKTTSFEYYPPNLTGSGNSYSIGRPKSKTELLQAYGDSKGSKEEYTYENNRLKTLKTYNRNNSGWLLDTYDYDGFGNIIEKIVSNSIDSQSQTDRSVYDDKGRFVIKKTDNLGLETHVFYNNWGQVTSQISPFGVTLTNIYDAWGKLLSENINTGGESTYIYEKLSDGSSKIIKSLSDGNQKITYTNHIGQTYKVTTKAFEQGDYISTLYEYDLLGRKIKESEPFRENLETPKWNIIAYDDDVYPSKITQTIFNGKKIEISISGRNSYTKELNGNNRTNSKTIDPLGNVIVSSDPGGIVNFAFNAAGQNISAQYDQDFTNLTYDEWGRKASISNASTGEYTYRYNGLGQLTNVKSPKGEKTYVYNNNGQLIVQDEVTTDGTQNTLKNIAFGYNSVGQLISKNGTSSGKSFSVNIEYDSYGRLSSHEEYSNDKFFFNREIEYDQLSRITNYTKGLVSSGITTQVKIRNNYSDWNGLLFEVKDQNNDKILWQLHSTNSKGQTIEAQLGETLIENTFDNSNFLNSTRHRGLNNGNTVLQLDYKFDAIKNELKTRIRGGDINIGEEFTYDNNNRLINWTDPISNQMFHNEYDEKGRIRSNSQIGEIFYEDSKKIYQPTDMDLSNSGVENYSNDLIQKIVYNENNDPVLIDGEIGDVRFEYGLTGMRQLVTYGGNFEKFGKYIKFYNEDGGFEITRNEKGAEKHIIYIEGTPYDSNTIFLKNYDKEEGSYFFLHKDYLGSILAVSDEKGVATEQRHYDAWGNFTHLKVKDAALLIGKVQILKYTSAETLLLDRGYTSHEHFLEVGLIHMNGRLYDPLLRRFLNPDNVIQDPYNTQNYNTYGYVLNNPLMFNDPGGEELVTLFGVAMFAIWKAVIIGAAVGLASYLISAAVTGQKVTVGGAIKATFWGAASGAATFGIGSIFTSSAGTAIVNGVGEYGKAIIQAAAHGISQGTMSLMQGASFGQAFLSGSLGSLGASAFGAIAGSAANSTVGSIGFGALAGGIGAELSGGNFWQGATIGLIVAGLNHGLHKMDGPTQKNPQQKNPWDSDGDGKMSLDEANSWYRTGNGKAVTLDASKVDLNSVDTKRWVKGQNYNVQTLINSSDGRVLGNITVKYLGNNQVSILADTYNFEQHGKFTDSPFRNAATVIGKWRAGEGQQFQINFKGINTIRPKVYNFERGPKY